MATNTADDESTALRDRMLAPLPVEERRLVLAGVSTAVLEGGDGPPVVLLHGQGEFAGTWGRVLPDLVTDHRVVVPDLPGHGASQVQSGRLDAPQVLEWLDGLVRATTSGRATIVGHLLGGAIAARFALHRPDRVHQLVLVDPFGLGRFRPSPAFALAMVGFVAHPTEATQQRLFDRCFLDHEGLRDELGDELAVLEAYALERARQPGVKVAIRRLMNQFGVPRIPARDLEQIACPVSMIWGRHDLQARVAIGEAARDRYGWPLHVIEQAADDPAVEQPTAFTATFRQALAAGRRRLADEAREVRA